MEDALDFETIHNPGGGIVHLREPDGVERGNRTPILGVGFVVLVLLLLQCGCGRESCKMAVLAPCWILGVALAIAIMWGAVAVLRQVTVLVAAGCMFIIFGYGGLAAATMVLMFPAVVGEKIADSICGFDPTEPSAAQPSVDLTEVPPRPDIPLAGDTTGIDGTVIAGESVGKVASAAAQGGPGSGVQRTGGDQVEPEQAAKRDSSIERTWSTPEPPTNMPANRPARGGTLP